MLVAPTVPTTPQSPPRAGSVISDAFLWAQLNATSSRKPTSSPELPPQFSAAPSTFLQAPQPQARRHQARMVGAGLPPLGLTPGLNKGGGVRSNKITSRGHLQANEPRGGDRAGVCPALGLYLTLPQQLGTFPVPPPPQPHGAQSPQGRKVYPLLYFRDTHRASLCSQLYGDWRTSQAKLAFTVIH